jgi:LCP family protein required for cell wall assembly
VDEGGTRSADEADDTGGANDIGDPGEGASGRREPDVEAEGSASGGTGEETSGRRKPDTEQESSASGGTGDDSADAAEAARTTDGPGAEAEKAAEPDAVPEPADEPASSNEPDGATRSRGARRGRRATRGLVRTVVALLSVVALGVTGYAYSTLDRLQDNVTTTDALRFNDAPPDDEHPPPPENDGATDILLVGTDSRTDMEGRPLPAHVLAQLRTESSPGVSTDTLIVLRIPHDGSPPTGISIPRDTWVEVPGRGHAKINSVYGVAKYDAERALRAKGVTDRAELSRESDQAGRAALVRTVQRFIDVRVDHYAEVNLLGFYLLTEALDGVRVCLNNPTSDPDSGANFAAGVQTVSGGEALSFVRQRKGVPQGDLGRIQRQQAFLASALHKVLSAGTLTDPQRLEKLAKTLRKSLVLDADLDLLEFAEQTRGIASGDFSFVTIPVVDIAAWSPDGEQSIVTVDVAEVREFVAGVVPDSARQSGGDESEPGPSGGGSAPQTSPDDEGITADGVTCVD